MQKKLAIEVKNLKKSYGKIPVLKDINLTVEPGTIFALLGPNGAGKTTLIRILTTLLKPDAGKAYVEGIDVVENPKAVQQVIGLTGQGLSLDNRLTGMENLCIMGRLYGGTVRDTFTRAKELIDQFDLAPATDMLVGTYSGGMRRKLDLAMSLIGNPSVLFLDEPTTGLDPMSRETLWVALSDLAKRGTTIVLTTQYLEEADRLADTISIIKQGTIIASGNAEQLKSQLSNNYLKIVLHPQEDVLLASSYLKNTSPLIKIQSQAIIVPLPSGIDGTKCLHEVLGILIEKKVHIQSQYLHKPTLDDVFINLNSLQKPLRKLQ